MNKKTSKRKLFIDLVQNNAYVSKPDLLWEIDLFYFPKPKSDNLDFLKDKFNRLTFITVVDSFSRKLLILENIKLNKFF